jgi:hypothetical protein
VWSAVDLDLSLADDKLISFNGVIVVNTRISALMLR